MLPTSHHLAFAVQYITLSGVLLLRCVVYGSQEGLVEAVIVDAEKCVELLEGMEGIWNGAKRCKEIVSDLLVVVKARHYGGLSALDAIQTTGGELGYSIPLRCLVYRSLIPSLTGEIFLPPPPRPKVPRGSASFLPNLRRWTPARVLDLTDHSLGITSGLLNRMTIGERVAVPLSFSGTGLLNIKAATSRPHQTPSPTDDCQM